jgi:CRISPR/Cas system-associated endoribonuclease Cas2
MSVFLVSYDLRKPDYDYDPLYAALAKIKAKHIQESVWGVNTTSSAEVVFDYLWQHMHNERDRLFVVTFDKSQDYKAKNSLEKLNSV